MDPTYTGFLMMWIFKKLGSITITIQEFQKLHYEQENYISTREREREM